MSYVKRILLFASIFLACLFISHKSTFLNPTFAQGEFETDYKVSYQVETEAKTTVTQNIALKNKTSNFYADKFELKIGSTKVEDVKAQDSAGPMEAQVKFENNVTTISVKFNQRVIGISKTLPWTLTYSSNELITKSGEIWEVSIPRLAKTGDIGSYQAYVSVPTSFGKLAFSAPEPKNTTQGGARSIFTFDRDQLFESGIAMSFGEKQTFSYELKYHLQNTNLTTQYVEIALPPDNNYQKIVLSSISPAPLDVVVDNDGNFLARYRLSSKSKLDVTAGGFVEVFSRTFRNISKTLTKQKRDLYTQPQQYWEIDNGAISNKAKALKSPKQIYDFVTNYLAYNKGRLSTNKLERKGAAAAFAAPKDAVCMEFTDLFIALARSAGIPAREVVGYAYTQNERLRPLSFAIDGKDVLHAWPEYWDEKLGWIQVDPTWGSTSGGLDYFNKMDFNHITFIQRGSSSSTSPYPAGSYKREGEKEVKDVNVQFAKELPQSSQSPDISLELPTHLISGLPTKVSATLKNVGTSSIIGGKLQLSSQTASITPSNAEIIDILPPYANRHFEFTLQSNKLLAHLEDNLILTFASTQIARPLQIVPFYNAFITVQFFLSMAIAAVITASGLYLYKRLHHKTAKNKLLG